MGLPADACKAYDRQVVALEQLQRSGLDAVKRLAPFQGMSDEEALTALQDASTRLEMSGTLAVVAAVEATLRVDMKERVSRGRPEDPTAGAFILLATSKGDKVSLEELLDVWKKLASATVAPIGQFKQQLKRRHWLAHGAYWADTSGVSPSPHDVLATYERLEQSLKAVSADFPRASAPA